jgi:hypothetical protein
LAVPFYLHTVLVYMARAIGRSDRNVNLKTLLADDMVEALLQNAFLIDSPLGHDLNNASAVQSAPKSVRFVMTDTSGAN